MTEQWRDIPGFNGIYQISDNGRIKRAIACATGGTYAGRLMNPKIDRFGYYRTCIRSPITGRAKCVRPHVAVLEAFIGPRPKDYDASHLNGIKTDNRLENLCWETSSENHRRKFSHGTLVHGEKHKCSKLKTEQVIEIRHRVANGERKARVAREYGVSNTLIGYIVSGRAWPHVERAGANE